MKNICFFINIYFLSLGIYDIIYVPKKEEDDSYEVYSNTRLFFSA